MSTQLGAPRHVVAGVLFTSPTAGGAPWGVRWAARFARERGCELRLVHACPDPDQAGTARRRVYELADGMRASSPGLEISAQIVAASTVQALVTESRSADMIIVDGPARTDRAALASSVSTRAHCPVAAVPPGAAWDHSDRPVVVGTNGGELAESTVLAAFTIAAALKTSVRMVCCTLGDHATVSRMVQAALTVTRACAARHPTVSLDVRLARSWPATGLARHASVASMLVIGAGRTLGDDSTSLHLLRRSAGPVVLVGPLTVTHSSTVD